MKKTAIILGAALLLFTATTNAQNDTLPKQPTVVQPDTMLKEPVTTMPTEQVTTPTEQVTTMTTNTDRWNNYSPDKYKMLPMPEPLTTEKIFPVIGHYNLTTSDAAANTENPTAETGNTNLSNVSITLDETNKGVAWIDGLPQGKIKAYLKASPATYIIPAQKTTDDKDIAQGVLIFDKDNNNLDVCIGCKYNNDDPASAFATTQPVAEEQPTATAKNKKKTAKAKVIPVKTWKYTGSKVEETTASVNPMQQQ